MITVFPCSSKSELITVIDLPSSPSAPSCPFSASVSSSSNPLNVTTTILSGLSKVLNPGTSALDDSLPSITHETLKSPSLYVVLGVKLSITICPVLSSIAFDVFNTLPSLEKVLVSFPLYYSPIFIFSTLNSFVSIYNLYILSKYFSIKITLSL